MKATDCFAEKRKLMNEIPTEKLLPQGLQDMLSAQRECIAQANDINNEIIDREMKISNVVLKRYTAEKGKSLKWYEWVMNPNTRESERVLRYAECTAVIDINQLDGNVIETPYEEYKEWWDKNYHCLGVTGL
jgi:hypothetical protein